MAANNISASDFQQVLDTILTFLRSPPQLDFEKVPTSEIVYDFPTIRLRERPVGTPTMSEVGEFFEVATGKFYYQNFFNPKIADELSWPNEKLMRRHGRYVIQNMPDVNNAKGINATPMKASSWFEEDLIDSIARSKQPTCTFLLGAPGAGKSTLIKYLINSKRDHSETKNVVFSRFESTKFFRFCEEQIAKESPDQDFEHAPFQKILALLSDYFFSIVLRDLILSHAYNITDRGLVLKDDNAYFRNPRTIDDLLFRAAESQASVTEQARQTAFYILIEAVGPTAFLHKELFQIDFQLRVALVRKLAVGKKVCVVFDGLDVLSPEDEELDHQKYEILKLVMKLFGLGLTTQRWPVQPGFDHHAIVLLRTNTYFYLIDRANKEIRTADLRPYEIGALPQHVVLFRAIIKGLRALNAYASLEDSEVREIAERLFQSLDTIMRVIGVNFRLSKKQEGVLGLFNGNIRDAFEFIARILYWVREESEGAHLTARPRISELLEFIASRQARFLLEQKAYRLIELLLFFQTSTFQNAIDVQKLRIVSDPKIQALTARVAVRKNNACRGLVDNVFNYHSFDHLNNNDDHKLLQKIRVLQICAQRATITDSQLRHEMIELGYESDANSDLGLAIMILRYAGFLDRLDEGAERRYSCTTKGRVVIEELLFQSSYIEHVYHKTLMPTSLVSRKDDSPRSESHQRWTVNSIRNYFILLTYIHFIENNISRQRSVPGQYRIWAKMRNSVVAAVRRILLQDYQEKRTRSPSTWFASMVLQEISEVVARWRKEGLIVEDEELSVGER
jgi:hypothetical protein